MQVRSLEDLARLVGNSADERIADDDANRRHANMTIETVNTKKAAFSSLPEPSKFSRDPGDRVMRLSAKWRRDRGLDDSAENQVASVQAVLSSRPNLAEAYKYRPDMLARAGGDVAKAFEDAEMEDE